MRQGRMKRRPAEKVDEQRDWGDSAMQENKASVVKKKLKESQLKIDEMRHTKACWDI